MKKRSLPSESPAVEAAPPSLAAPITYVDVCQHPDCPAPNDESWHHCFVCQAAAIDHAHVISRAQAPGRKHDPDNLVALCRRDHDAVDLHHTHGHAVRRLGDGLLHYFYWQSTPYKELADRVIGEGGGSVGNDTLAKGACVIASDNQVATPLATAAGGTTKSAPSSPASLSAHPVLGDRRGTKKQSSGYAVEDGASPAPISDHPRREDARIGTQDARETAPTLYPTPMPTTYGGEPCDEPVTATVPAVSYEAMSDEELATLYADADRRQRDGFLDKCAAVYTYRERHIQAWGESWTEQASKLFEGNPSRRTLYAYANLWGAAEQISASNCTYIAENIGPLTDSRSLMQFIGQKSSEQAVVALEAAVSYVAEYGEAPSKAALAHKLGEEEEPRAACVHEFELRCKRCGARSA